MPNYRRAAEPGGIFFLTIVTNDRKPIFSEPSHIDRLRIALRRVKAELPFQISAAVVLPDHIHFLWSLPRGDTDFSGRVGRMKVLFTRSLAQTGELSSGSNASRRKHRESDVWQRRFWEHTIRDDEDFERHLDYIHDNPVKHGLVTCPHLWPNSSYQKWARAGHYRVDWGCCCHQERSLSLPELDHDAGE